MNPWGSTTTPSKPFPAWLPTRHTALPINHRKARVSALTIVYAKRLGQYGRPNIPFTAAFWRGVTNL